VREGCAPFHTPLPTLPFFFSLFLPLLFLILPVGEEKQTCMFPRDVAVHLLQVGVKVLLSSRFGARWRGDVLQVLLSKLSKCCRMLSKCCRMLTRSCRLLQELQVLLSKLSSAAECCPSAAECCPEVAGCCRSHVCAALEDGAGHMYVLLGVDCCIERRCRVVCCLQELSK